MLLSAPMAPMALLGLANWYRPRRMQRVLPTVDAYPGELPVPEQRAERQLTSV